MLVTVQQEGRVISCDLRLLPEVDEHTSSIAVGGDYENALLVTPATLTAKPAASQRFVSDTITAHTPS